MHAWKIHLEKLDEGSMRPYCSSVRDAVYPVNMILIGKFEFR
jgi:hypothetical protein